MRAATTTFFDSPDPRLAMEQTQENMGRRAGPEAGNSRRSSDVWNHFSVWKDGNGADVASCNYCQKSYGADTTNGTSHLSGHLEKCGGQGGPPQKQPRRQPPAIQATNHGEPSVLLLDASNTNLQAEPSSLTLPAQSSWFNHEECSTKLVRMIAFHGYPSSIVDDECFGSFVRDLNPQFQMPSRAAVEGACRRRAQDASNQLKETLAHCSGLISLLTGTAGTGQGKALYMACQFVDQEWTLQKRIMQVFKVVPFPPYQHGALLGIEEVSIEIDEEILEEEEISCNRTTTSLLEKAAAAWGLRGRLYSVAWGEELRTRLDLDGALEQFGPPMRFGKGQSAMPMVTYTSDVLSSAADAIFSMLCPYAEENCFNAAKDLRLDPEKRARYFSELGLNHVGRYDKRWYSYYCALEVLHKEFADNNVASVESPERNHYYWSEELGTDNKEVLKRYRRKRQVTSLFELSRFKENQLTELLRKILGVTYRAIQRISSSSWPTSNLCIFELMKLRKVLQSEATDAREDITKALNYAKINGFMDRKDVHTVLLDARLVLDKFLKGSLLYLPIPAALDPRFKLDYVTNVFKEVFGTEAPTYISKVKERIEHIFEMKCQNGGEGTSSMAAGMCTAAMSMGNNPQDGGSITELEHYLTHPPIPPQEREGFDVLMWWKENSHRYPTVASMARDALAVPASDMLSPEHLALVRSTTSSCWW